MLFLFRKNEEGAQRILASSVVFEVEQKRIMKEKEER
jgi:hypothetical protein